MSRDQADQKQYRREQKIEAIKDGRVHYFKLIECYINKSIIVNEALALANKEYSWSSAVHRTPSEILKFTLNYINCVMRI